MDVFEAVDSMKSSCRTLDYEPMTPPRKVRKIDNTAVERTDALNH